MIWPGCGPQSALRGRRLYLGGFRLRLPFGGALHPTLLLFLLLLFARLFSAAFFQLVVLLNWPILSVPFLPALERPSSPSPKRPTISPRSDRSVSQES